jgi:hypothetical protein
MCIIVSGKIHTFCDSPVCYRGKELRLRFRRRRRERRRRQQKLSEYAGRFKGCAKNTLETSVSFYRLPQTLASSSLCRILRSCNSYKSQSFLVLMPGSYPLNKQCELQSPHLRAQLSIPLRRRIVRQVKFSFADLVVISQ